MHYSKPSCTLDEMLELLRSRGMEIEVSEENNAKHLLMHASYYRLSAYWYPFREYGADGIKLESFRAGTKFSKILQLYLFDRELRLELVAALDAIEISFRGVCAYRLAQAHGPCGYLDPSIFKNDREFQRFKLPLDREIQRSKDPVVAHFKTNYGNFNEFPIWMATEVMSFGTLSKLVDGLKSRALKNKISHTYQLDEHYFCSIMHHLVYIRNICAHHGRMWNKDLVIKPYVPQVVLRSFKTNEAPSRVYTTIIMCDYLASIINPKNNWLARVKSKLDRHGDISLVEMGFPKGWETMSPWKELS